MSVYYFYYTLLAGPALGHDSSGGTGHTRSATSLRVVLDGDSTFVDSLPKEEKLLLGIDITREESKN